MGNKLLCNGLAMFTRLFNRVVWKDTPLSVWRDSVVTSAVGRPQALSVILTSIRIL